MIIILVLVIALVAWSLHLMQEAIEYHEFSLMLAGFLVAAAAAAMVAVYFLMGNYMGYMTQMSHRSYSSEISLESSAWATQADEFMQDWVNLTGEELSADSRHQATFFSSELVQ